MNVLITGVSKGIGLALTQLALEKNHQVFGVVRQPQKSPELLKLKNQYPHLKLIELDLMDQDADQKLEFALKECSHLDLVINNAGVYEKGNTKEDFLKSFEVNTFIPFMVANATLPKLKKSSNPKLVHISSMMGSIADNTSGGSYAYRASKAALNMVNKCLTNENDWLTTAVMHPGWVQTSMGGESAPTSTLESSQGIWKVVESLTKNDSGCFKDYQGRNLPW